MLSLIIPTYNERENLPGLIDDLKNTLQGNNFEIIVIDDNSPDKTWELEAFVRDKIPKARLIRRMNARGLSSAVIAGFNIAEGDILGVIDADRSHDVQLLNKMVCLINDKAADCVIGSRYIEGGGVKHWPWYRRFSSYTSALLTRSLVKRHISDPLSGFFCISKSVYQRMAHEVRPKGFKILMELLVKGRPDHVVELPYVFKDRVRGNSKLSAGVTFAYCIQWLELSWHQMSYRWRQVKN